mgnify:CR=1 FL=1
MSTIAIFAPNADEARLGDPAELEVGDWDDLQVGGPISSHQCGNCGGTDYTISELCRAPLALRLAMPKVAGGGVGFAKCDQCSYRHPIGSRS